MSKRTDPELLFHYTSHVGFASILESKEFWAHDYRLANDRREISYARGLIRFGLDELNQKKYQATINDILAIFGDPFDPFELKEIDDYIVIASLSEEENQLSQWRAYAPDSGYALGFDKKLLFSLAKDQGFEVGRVLYDFKKQNELIRVRLRDFLGEEVLLRETHVGRPIDIIERFHRFSTELAPLIKHESFHEEREWRVFRHVEPNEIKFNRGAWSIRPYLPLQLASPKELIKCLRAVRVGPADNQMALRQWTVDYLRNHGYEIDPRGDSTTGAVSVRISGSPYRLVKK